MDGIEIFLLAFKPVLDRGQRGVETTGKKAKSKRNTPSFVCMRLLWCVTSSLLLLSRSTAAYQTRKLTNCRPITQQIRTMSINLASTLSR